MGEGVAPTREAGDATPAPAPIPVTFLGHSTVVFTVDEARILVDPMLRSGVGVGMLRWMAPAVAPEVVRASDVVLISHLHNDHLDVPSLWRLGRRRPLVVPRGAGPLLRRRGFTDVTEVSVGDSLEVNGSTITAVFADHSGYRPPFGPKVQALGFLVQGPTRRVYYAGDTDYFPQMAEFADPPLDLALLPVWGWGPNLGPGHLDPVEAARALALLDPHWGVPVHWGGLWLRILRGERKRLLIDPPREFAEAAARLGLAERVVTIEPGQTHTFEGEPRTTPERETPG
jgi:L-ascorbate metabolism protein UlaG (beta-lactamase superfamily)